MYHRKKNRQLQEVPGQISDFMHAFMKYCFIKDTKLAYETNCHIGGPTASKSSGKRNCRLIKDNVFGKLAAWELGMKFTLHTMKYSQLPQRRLLS